MSARHLKRLLRRAACSDVMPDAVVLVARYWFVHRRFPNLIRPRRFTEKMLLRLLFDRRQELAVMADKLMLRDYARDRAGDGLLPALFHVTTDPRTIPFDELPEKFVVKPTHGSQWVRIVTDKTKLDREELIDTCNGWLRENYYRRTREWGYKRVVPRILVEELIEDGNLITPNDYKLFVYNGRTEFIHVVVGRFTTKAHIVMTPSWQPVDVYWPTCGEHVEVPRPLHLQEMLETAERLARGFDFIRVDLYDTAERLVIGEVTGTAGAASEHFRPDSFDHVLGEPWQLNILQLVRDRTRRRTLRAVVQRPDLTAA